MPQHLGIISGTQENIMSNVILRKEQQKEQRRKQELWGETTTCWNNIQL
jgi:hypothetical protein